MSRIFPSYSTLAAAGLVLAACSDSSGGGAPGTEPQLRISLAARAGTAAALRGASLADPYSITDGSNTLVYESVQLVVREIELKRADRDVVCGEDDRSRDDDDSRDDSNDDSSEDRVMRLSDDDDCEELEFGPLLFDVPLGVGPERVFTVEIAPGIYDKLEFEIHKPESSDDAAFLAANPGFNGVSVKVTGTFNGTPFTYVSDLNEEQERALVPPLELAEAQATDLTFFVDIDRWFRTSSGTLVDPATANEGGVNEDLVEENIENSIDAFEDDDRDGDDDHDDDDDDDRGDDDSGSDDD
ncbi:MAG: hypothetical protein MUC69_01025 [Gemmatimonadales bacterium]|nr:hypothetical protein [Gemmatimonadales bacterium]